MLRGRLRVTTYRYDDPDHPDRPTAAVESPAWTEDDRALLLALAEYEGGLCPGCGEPKQHAWHADLDGWYEAADFVCHACTALQGRQVVYGRVEATVPVARLGELAPLEIGVNTTPPAPPT